MNWKAVTFDWNQARAFLAVVEQGSFTGAARVLDLTQPTLSRQIAALEAELGITLFERGPRLMTLTETGNALVEHVRAMAAHAAAFSLTATGRAAGVEGLVTVTATGIVASRLLAPVIARLREEAPGLEIEILASNAIQDLSRREADIAIRHVQPDGADLYARLIGGCPACFHAAPAYLDRRGRPQTLADLAGHDIIGFERPDAVSAALAGYGVAVDPAQVKLRTTDGEVILALVRQGLGLSILTSDIAAECGLEPVLADRFEVPVPYWLVTHRELKTNARIRLVFDRIANHLKGALNRRAPGSPVQAYASPPGAGG